MSHKLRRLAISVGAAKSFAALDACDEGKVLKRSIAIMFILSINFIVALDSRDLYPLLTKSRSIENFI